MTAYELHVHCPECKNTHRAAKFYLWFLSPSLDGALLLEAMGGKEPLPKVQAILVNGILCDYANKQVNPDRDQFFLRIGISAS